MSVDKKPEEISRRDFLRGLLTSNENPDTNNQSVSSVIQTASNRPKDGSPQIDQPKKDRSRRSFLRNLALITTSAYVEAHFPVVTQVASVIERALREQGVLSEGSIPQILITAKKLVNEFISETDKQKKEELRKVIVAWLKFNGASHVTAEEFDLSAKFMGHFLYGEGKRFDITTIFQKELLSVIDSLPHQKKEIIGIKENMDPPEIMKIIFENKWNTTLARGKKKLGFETGFLNKLTQEEKDEMSITDAMTMAQKIGQIYSFEHNGLPPSEAEMEELRADKIESALVFDKILDSKFGIEDAIMLRTMDDGNTYYVGSDLSSLIGKEINMFRLLNLIDMPVFQKSVGRCTLSAKGTVTNANKNGFTLSNVTVSIIDTYDWSKGSEKIEDSRDKDSYNPEAGVNTRFGDIIKMFGLDDIFASSIFDNLKNESIGVHNYDGAILQINGIAQPFDVRATYHFPQMNVIGDFSPPPPTESSPKSKGPKLKYFTEEDIPPPSQPRIFAPPVMYQELP